LEELISLTDDLPYLSEQIEVPKGMRARVLENIYDEEAVIEDSYEKGEEQKVVELKKKSGRSRFLIPAIAAALFLSLATNVYLYRAVIQNAKSDEILPTSQVTLLPPDGQGDGVAIASILSAAGQESILLQASNLPKLKDDEVYQLWVLEGNQPYPAGAFQTNDSGQGTLTYSLEGLEGDWDTIAITVEQEPDLPTPQGDIVLAGGI
jgi:Anti-sigma-K factor rskA